VLFLYPLVNVFHLGFYKYHPVFGKSFIGLNNYKDIFIDSTFLFTIFRTFLYAAGCVTVSFCIGMGYALLTAKPFKGVKIIRTVFIAPMLFIPAGAALVWALCYNEQVGIINHVLSLFGFQRKMWLAYPKTGFIATMIADIWGWTPFVYLILLAGLQSLPSEPYEAAKIDGASSLQQFLYLTLPLMRPVIAVAVIIKTMDSFRAFVYIWIMTRGGPGNSTQVLSTLIYQELFLRFNYGMGSAMAVVSFLLALVIALSLIVVFKHRIGR
jgi:multiple sugar transport system permease protein